MTLAPVTLNSGIAARDAWPFAGDVVPLNHGSFGAVPTEIVDRRAQLLRLADESPVGWFPHVGEYVGHARERVASFVGASAADTVFAPNASGAASVVFNALRLQPGDEILVTDHGYGAVTMGARRLARRFGAVLRTVAVDLAGTASQRLDAFREAIGERTRLVVVDQITSSTALLLPTAEITQLAHAVGARVLVDGAHAPGLIADAACAAGADWWIGNLHKWPCAPRGAALLVTRAADRDELWPLIDSWGGDLPFPERFDHQGTLDATTWLTAPDSIEFIEREYGWDRTRAAMSRLADAAQRAVADALAPHMDQDPVVTADNAVSMRLLRLPGTLGATREEADSLRGRLYDATRIESAFTSFRGTGYLRISAHLYTTPDDAQAFIDRAVPLLVDWARG